MDQPQIPSTVQILLAAVSEVSNELVAEKTEKHALLQEVDGLEGEIRAMESELRNARKAITDLTSNVTYQKRAVTHLTMRNTELQTLLDL
jgi:predicted nuclease with TOPRIM domain